MTAAVALLPFLKFDTPERRAHARRLGPVGFTLFYGVFVWGGLMAVIFSLLGPLLGFVPGPDGPLNYVEKVWRGAPLAFAVFPACGLLWGAAMWIVIRVTDKKASPHR